MPLIPSDHLSEKSQQLLANVNVTRMADPAYYGGGSPRPIVVEAIPTPPKAAGPARARRATIVSLGDSLYRVGSGEPVKVTADENNFLLVFLDDSRLTLREIVNESGLDADTVKAALRGLLRKYKGQFAAAIDRPGRKGRGGYHVRIRQG